MPEIMQDARTRPQAGPSGSSVASCRLVADNGRLARVDGDKAGKNAPQNSTPAAARSIDPAVRHASATPVADAPQSTGEQREGSSSTGSTDQKNLHASSCDNMEARRCSGCGGTMTASRYRRSLIRFMRVYRCQDCRLNFEQDTRGYQGFHFGLVASLGTPILYACIAKPAVSFAEIGLVGLVLFLLFWPIAINLGHYLKSPVIALNIASPLLPVSSGRKIWGRILGGDSRLYGLCLGAITGVTAYLLMVLLLVAVVLI